MKTPAERFSIGIVRPGFDKVFVRSIKATHRAWCEAIWGMGGTKKRVGGAKIGTIDGQPIAVVGEMPEDVPDGAHAWAIQTDTLLYAFAGPCAVYNDAGFGPASLGISRERLDQAINFNPDVVELAEGLRNTLASRGQKVEPDQPV